MTKYSSPEESDHLKQLLALSSWLLALPRRIVSRSQEPGAKSRQPSGHKLQGNGTKYGFPEESDHLKQLLALGSWLLALPRGATPKSQDPGAKSFQPSGHELLGNGTKPFPQVTIFCDGGCSPNPGPGGWAAILRCGKVERKLSGGEAKTTNNRMELTAVTRALEALKQPCRVTVVTDSEYLANAFRQKWIEKWKRNGWKAATKEPVKNKDLWVVLDALAARHQINWQWCRGHSGHPENERCDQMVAAVRQRLFGA